MRRARLVRAHAAELRSGPQGLDRGPRDDGWVHAGVPDEDRCFKTKKQFEDELAVFMAGQVAE
jgi:hypothetical protein